MKGKWRKGKVIMERGKAGGGKRVVAEGIEGWGTSLKREPEREARRQTAGDCGREGKLGEGEGRWVRERGSGEGERWRREVVKREWASGGKGRWGKLNGGKRWEQEKG